MCNVYACKMEIHVCSLKNAEEKTDGEYFAGNRTTHQNPTKKRVRATLPRNNVFLCLEMTLCTTIPMRRTTSTKWKAAARGQSQ